jgi:YhcG PDDEXK nuclease domain
MAALSTQDTKFKVLPLKMAYLFLEANGLVNEVAAVKTSHRNIALTKGKIIDLLERNNLLDEFIKTKWPSGTMRDAKNRIQYYKRAYRQEAEDAESLEQTGDDVLELIPPPEPIDQYAFVLEKYLEEFIVSNFQSIFKGKLSIHKDGNEVSGQPYSTSIGPIDILAFEPESKSFLVIELKKGRPADQVVGQILRYMGWVKKNLCTDGQSVKGLVICRDSDDKLSYALDMTNNIDVRYYRVSFDLREAS